MFYSEDLSKSYRMGDIIENFYEVIPYYDKNSYFSIKLIAPAKFVILTPCCSIEKQEAIIVPLKKINEHFIVSEFLRENLLLINTPISKEEVLGKEAYDNALKNISSEEEKILFTNIQKRYEFCDSFIFDEHSMLEEYLIERKRKDNIISKKTRCYMISFKDAMKVQSLVFERGQPCNKILELSPQTRDILRKKLSSFYSRIPDEDKPYINN